MALGFSLVAEELATECYSAAELSEVRKTLERIAEAAEKVGDRMIEGTVALARDYIAEVQDFLRRIEEEDAA